MSEEENHSIKYYQSPTFLTATDYIRMLEHIKTNGDCSDVVEGTLSLFKNIEDGYKYAYDFLSEVDTQNLSFRGWLAWRVIYQAINYFSRLWRADKDIAKYFEDYILYLKFEEKCLQHPYVMLKVIAGAIENEDEMKSEKRNEYDNKTERGIDTFAKIVNSWM